MTVYSVERISPRPAQTSRPTGQQTKHWLHNVLQAVPYGHVSLAYGQHGQYFSLTGQYQHVFLSNRTVDSTTPYGGVNHGAMILSLTYYILIPIITLI